MTESRQTLSVVIPVYNEVDTIAKLIERVRQAPSAGMAKEIIVVDDGSTDGTRDRLMHLPGIRPMLQPENRGKGAAVRAGFEAATGDILLIQDADMEYDPADYPAMVEPILRGEADAVIGSRFRLQKMRFFSPNGDIFFSHFLGNKLIVWLTNLLYGFRATDYEGCYKAFTREVAQENPVEATGFDFDNELVCKLLRQKRRITEVPIHYHPRLYSEGKKIRWQHGVQMLWTIVKWRVLPVRPVRAARTAPGPAGVLAAESQPELVGDRASGS